MPHEIKVGDVYETENGGRARIICTDRVQPDYPVVALVMMGEMERVCSYTERGKFYDGLDEAEGRDLVLPQGPYDDWQIDDPIWVWDGKPEHAQPRHFAGIADNGKVLAWGNGLTSHSTVTYESRTYFWQHASKTDPRTR
jgi:hypothetical protein